MFRSVSVHIAPKFFQCSIYKVKKINPENDSSNNCFTMRLSMALIPLNRDICMKTLFFDHMA